MSRIFWDTNLFIYLLEDYGGLSRRVSEIRTRMVERGDELLTSALTLGEVLVKLRGPDAVQLAGGGQARVDLFITNDDRLPQKTVSGIQFVQSIRRAFL